ncbi:cytochrome P450 [Mycena alexandri]|uniref:Cytochrome P450 n=1 Tax=Mycena alexandri TaxID=1745969 RepID=A0AAD6T1G4_9AGAR|nr:cytochrome P450 [Mycena alexandri]
MLKYNSTYCKRSVRGKNRTRDLAISQNRTEYFPRTVRYVDYLFTPNWIEFQAKGDLVYLHGLGNSVLIVNSLSSVQELFEKRWNIYSHRPIFTAVGELMGVDQVALMPYGEEWREHRKITYAALNPRAVKAWHRAQEDLAAIMIKDILERSDEFSRHIRLTASRIVLYIGYGVFASDMEDPYIEDNEETMDIIGRAMTPGAFLCDLISILKYSPSWVPFQRQIKKSKEVIDRTVYQPYIDVKDQVERGTASPSLATNLITAGDSDPEIEHRNTWAVSSLYGAGTKTTASTVHTFVLAMALNPAVQKQAQSEIDNVVGTNRMPTISDMPNLPYVRALIKETLRWHPTRIIQSKITIPRRTAQDDSYGNYFIPKNTIVFPNIWAISRETPDPENFDPDRFLGSDAPADPFNYAFGVGRRICTGVYLAENSVFAMISGILASFDIAPVAGMTLVPKFTQKHVSSPEPFECSITSRSSGRVELIARRATEVIIGT